jgi:hypothetical protein
MAILSERMANRWVFGLESGRCRTSYNAIIEILLEQYPLIRTQSSLSKWRGKCSDRVRIFQELYKYMIYIGNFMDPNLAKVGVEGSNPFARSNYFNNLGGGAFAALSVVAAYVFISVLIGSAFPAVKGNETNWFQPKLRILLRNRT